MLPATLATLIRARISVTENHPLMEMTPSGQFVLDLIEVVHLLAVFLGT
jgi:hypothetical protein